MSQQFGVIGLAVMGENIALNIERNGFPIAVYNRSYDKTQRFLEGRAKGKNVVGAKDLKAFVEALERPRRILLMVKAGGPVDSVIALLKPLLDEGDIIIDGGNSLYKDTERRSQELQPTGIKFFGMGISGGEEGALWGPSLMPGGDKETYTHLSPILQKIAANVDDEPCVTYVGNKSAGHFVKMVHNGIEYGDMQLIAESHEVMRYALGMEPSEIADTFRKWNEGILQSYLIEITSHIVDFPDDQGKGGVLLDKILDAAGQKGTGKWTTISALELGVPIPTITAAVDARIVSSFKELRLRTAEVYPHSLESFDGDKSEIIESLHMALYASKICSYAQGFMLIQEASKEFGYDVNLAEVARIWRGGCIIRAGFLNKLRDLFGAQPDIPNILLAPTFQDELREGLPHLRKTVGWALSKGIPMPAMSASLAYFDAFRSKRLSANVIQAQRDFFGAHTYRRVDQEGVFHTQWPTLLDEEQ